VWHSLDAVSVQNRWQSLPKFFKRGEKRGEVPQNRLSASVTHTRPEFIRSVWQVRSEAKNSMIFIVLVFVFQRKTLVSLERRQFSILRLSSITCFGNLYKTRAYFYWASPICEAAGKPLPCFISFSSKNQRTLGLEARKQNTFYYGVAFSVLSN
jgi:hypothetical protein